MARRRRRFQFFSFLSDFLFVFITVFMEIRRINRPCSITPCDSLSALLTASYATTVSPPCTHARSTVARGSAARQWSVEWRADLPAASPPPPSPLPLPAASCTAPSPRVQDPAMLACLQHVALIALRAHRAQARDTWW